MTTLEDAVLALLILGFVMAFLLSFVTGAHDVANAFGTSYGAGVLNFMQIVILGSIFETAGSLLLGGKVADTMARGIADIDLYKDNVYGLMYGYLAALVGGTAWLAITIVFKLPVSSTHSTVGAIIGFTMVAYGPVGVKWNKLGLLVASWFVSPLLTGFISSLLYLLVKFLILRNPDPVKAAGRYLPILYGLMFSVISFMVISEALAQYGDPDIQAKLPLWLIAVIAIGLGIICWLVTWLVAMPWIRRRVALKIAESEAAAAASQTQPVDSYQSIHGDEPNPTCWSKFIQRYKASAARSTHRTNKTRPSQVENQGIADKLFAKLPSGLQNCLGTALCMEGYNRLTCDCIKSCNKSGNNSAELQEVNNTAAIERDNATHRPISVINVDLEQKQDDNDKIKATANLIPVEADELPGVRHTFTFLQVVSAVFMSFSHGTNDVSHAIGPLTGMYSIYQTHQLAKDLKPEWWLLLFGGVGMSIGLALLGDRVLTTIGDRLARISPATGFCMELGTATTVLVASHLGIPVSTTNCVIGAVVFVSLLRDSSSIDWRVARNIFFSWIITVPVAGLIGAAVMAILRAIFDSLHTFSE